MGSSLNKNPQHVYNNPKYFFLLHIRKTVGVLNKSLRGTEKLATLFYDSYSDTQSSLRLYQRQILTCIR